MDSPYGGYGLFYARVLEDMRLTRIGAPAFVDRATETGKTVAAAFARAFEKTRYYRDFFESDIVPREVLLELGQAACLCTIPGRPDHQPLLDAFFGDRLEDAVWEDRRRTRIQSLALFLDFHRQRPPAVATSRLSFQVALAQAAFADGTRLQVPFTEHQNSWRAYQLRECETLALTTIWTRYLQRLGELDPIPHADLRDDLVVAADWGEAGLEPERPLAELLETAYAQLSTGGAVVEAAQAAASDPRDDVGSALAGDLRLVLAVSAHAISEDAGFAELRDEGGPGRWSLAHLHDWLEVRHDETGRSVLAQLLDELHFQHIRVALSKVSPTDSRDPFCFADDDGLLRLIRQDEPFWTGARYEVVNHLLWTLGLLNEPSGEIRPTELGDQILAQVNADA